MGIFQNNLMGAAAAAASAGGGEFYSHQIANSCRFDGSSAFLNKTFGSAGSRTTATLSSWVKRSAIGARDTIFSVGTGATLVQVRIGLNDQFEVLYTNNDYALISTAVFRDLSAFYHFVVTFDTGNGTDAYKIRVYVNGTEITAWGTDNRSSFTGTQSIGQAALTRIGCYSGGTSDYWNGYIAETVYIDGTALAATSFGTNTNGVWIPDDVSGLTFSTNGFYLKFESSGDLGNDSSGNNNDWTVNNIAATDQMLDSPTFSATDGNGGNFCTYNPLNAGTSTTLSEGNLKVTGSSASASFPSGTMAFTSGKWYFERYISAYSSGYPYMGLAAIGNVTQTVADGGDIWATRFNPVDGTVIVNSGANITGFGTITPVSTGLATATTGDIIGFHLDCDNRKCWITKNGAFVNSGDPSAGTNPQWSWTATPINPITFFDQLHTSSSSILNAGQDGTFAGALTAQGNADENGYGNFYYAPDTGFLAMCAANLPTAAEVDPAQTDDDYPQKLFAPKLYTGDAAATLTISGMDFQPDFTWIKNRDAADSHCWFDSTRGVTELLSSDTNAAEATDADTLKSWTSDGYTVGADVKVNTSGEDYASWNWRANGGSTSAGSGDLTSTHQVDPSGGFSIVKAVGDGGSGDKTISHGLSATPTCILAKNLDSAYNWDTFWAQGLTATSYSIRLNTTDNQLSGRWGTVNSSIITCKENYTWVGTDNFVYYCFANTEGYIKSGTYVGNGNDDGTFVYTGHRPAMIILREVAVDNWLLYDDKRMGFNSSSAGNSNLYPDSNAAEGLEASRAIDILSNGFKLRTSNATGNASGGNYIYIAIAHNPFQYATAR